MSSPSSTSGTLIIRRLVSSNLRRDLFEIAAAVDAAEPDYVLEALLLRARFEARRTWSGPEFDSWFAAIESNRLEEPEARRRAFEEVDHA